MKRIISAAVAMILFFSATAFAADELYINGRKTNALVGDGDTGSVAVRDFFQNAGYFVQWNGTGRYASVYNDDTRIIIFVGKNFIFIDDTVYYSKTAAEISDGSLIIPISAAATAIDAAVEYKNGNIYFTSEKAADTYAWEYEILSLTNAERAKYGLPELVWNATLATAAKKHCDDMIARGYFSHDTPDGITPFGRMAALGIKYTYAAENIAAGQPSPKSVLASWLASDEHRKNILDEKLCEMGAAFSYGGKYGIYWAQEFATVR